MFQDPQRCHAFWWVLYLKTFIKHSFGGLGLSYVLGDFEKKLILLDVFGKNIEKCGCLLGCFGMSVYVFGMSGFLGTY